VEQRYAEAQSAVDSLLDATRVFQQRYGVFDLSAQTQGFFTYLAELRANTLQAEIQYEALRERLGEENEQVKTYRDLSRSAARKYADAVGGREALLPVPQNTVPEVVRQYADLERERIIQTRILEIVAPLLEQARFEELRKVEAVQVVDMAFPPALKAAPKRSIIVVMATLSAFLLTVLFVLVYTWWEREGTRILSRLRRP
jgi:capsule polysaccharide export protein KpsE/RkpR